MKIRRAAEHELLELWGYESIHTASSNAKFFCGSIKRGNAEFWRQGKEEIENAVCRVSGKDACKPGDSALRGVRPEALPLDSATFEKVDETFNLRISVGRFIFPLTFQVK